MESLFLDRFLTLKLSFMLRCLSAVFLFSWKLPRQPRYWGRLVTWSAVCFLAAVLIPVRSHSTFYVTSMFLVEFLLAMCGIKICCKTEWSVVFYIGAAALSAAALTSSCERRAPIPAAGLAIKLTPITSRPIWRAAMASTAVLIPTASAPQRRNARISSGLS